MKRYKDKSSLLWAAGFLLFVAATSLAYSNTLNAPFVFDDYPNILNNTYIRMDRLTLSGIVDLVKNKPSRVFAHLTFALDYYFHGYNVTGYHLTNIAIHILAGLLLFVIARKTLALAGSQKEGTLASFFAALLFLLAPVHTQAVTYIVQRMASMAAMFCLLALFLYIKARLKQREGRIKSAAILFVLSVLSWLLALRSKQIAAILPVMALLYEWYFFQGLDRQWIKRKTKWIAACALLLFCIAALFLGSSPIDKILSMYDDKSFTMGQRLLTEPRVIFLYLSLLLYPNPSRLNLDYDFPVSTSLLSPPTTILSIIGILALIIVAALTAKKHRLFSFAILWFLGCLAIESSFLGLALVFEHRVYMPSAFIFVWLAFFVLKTLNPRPLAIAILCVACAISGFWTYQRNSVWTDDVSLWQDVVKKSPNNARAYNNLGLALQDKKKIDKAITAYKSAIAADAGYSKAYNNLGFALLEAGKPEEAIRFLKNALQINPSFKEAANNLAIAYSKIGRQDKAIEYCRKLIDGCPEYTEAKNTLGVLLMGQGKTTLATEWFKKALNENPYHLEALMNMGIALQRLGKPQKAKQYLEKASRLHPEAASAWYRLGELSGKQGEYEEAYSALSKALSLDPGDPKVYNALGNVMLAMGKTTEAEGLYKKAIEIDPAFTSAHCNLAGLVAMEGEVEKAVQYLDTKVKEFPEDIELLLKLGELCQGKGDASRVVDAYKTALSKDPSCATCLNRLAAIYSSTGQNEKAIECYERLALLSPGNPKVFYNLACLYSRSGKKEKAVENLQKAIELSYDDIEHIKNDPDLDNIRNTTFYKTTIENGQNK